MASVVKPWTIDQAASTKTCCPFAPREEGTKTPASTPRTKPNGHPISGIATSIDATGAVNGYWLVIRDGGVLSFGSAPFWGSSGGNDRVVTSIVSFPSSQAGNNNPETVGYAWINNQGRVGMCTKDRPCGGTVTASAP